MRPAPSPASTARSATLVLVSPGGLSLAPAQELLLSRYSSRPPTSLGELGRLGPPGPVGWSGEGRRVHCFERVRGKARGAAVATRKRDTWSTLILVSNCTHCQKFTRSVGLPANLLCGSMQVLVCQGSNAQPGTGSPAPLAGNALAEELEADPQRPLPRDPAGFGPDAFPEGDKGGSDGVRKAKRGRSSSSGDGSVLRVLFERRGGPVRRISNLDALLKECKKLNKAGKRT